MKDEDVRSLVHAERERMVKSVANMIGHLSTGFTPSEFLTALSLTAAGIIHTGYPRSEYHKRTAKLGKDAAKFLKDFKP
jgi:hypothetical protein